MNGSRTPPRATARSASHSTVSALRWTSFSPAAAARGRRSHRRSCPHGAAVFFSEELCANYFSYTAQGRAHFILFDTAETLRCKLRLGRERGMETAFLMYPEVSDLLPELLNA